MQQEFVAVIKEYKQTLVDSDTKAQEIAGKNQDVVNKNQDVDGEIIQLEKNLALANAEVAAKQVSYNTVVGGLTGGLETQRPTCGQFPVEQCSLGCTGWRAPHDWQSRARNGRSVHDRLFRTDLP